MTHANVRTKSASYYYVTQGLIYISIDQVEAAHSGVSNTGSTFVLKVTPRQQVVFLSPYSKRTFSDGKEILN